MTCQKRNLLLAAPLIMLAVYQHSVSREKRKFATFSLSAA